MDSKGMENKQGKSVPKQLKVNKEEFTEEH